MFEHLHHVHLVGANGVGLSALGKLFLHLGKHVSASDLHGGMFADDLAELGAQISIGHAASNVPETTDLLVYSSAVHETNPERERARERGVREMSYAQVLGELSRTHPTIAVSGTHGKSTTTAMVGLILEAAGLNPMVIVGSRVPSWKDGNFRMGSGRDTGYIVVEACEYRENHLNLYPEIGVITNIEEDHLDYYRDLKHIEESFEQFARQSKQVVRNAPKVDFELQIPGEYNKENAGTALAVARLVGVDDAVSKKALQQFSGIWRRFERLGMWNGADVVSDYGHHPSAVYQSIDAARGFFRDRRIVHVFQPHQHSRTKELFDDFVPALGRADVTIVPEIYGVAGRTEDEDISSNDLVEAVKKERPDTKIYYAKDLDAAEALVRDHIEGGDVLFIQGAGDVDDLARKLV